MNKSLVLLVLTLNGSMLLSCQQKSVSDVAGVQGGVVNSLTATKQTKPGAQVSLLSEGEVILIADKVASVDILLGAQVGDGAMHVELNPSEGLQLRGAGGYDFVRSENGQYSIKTELYAATNGRYYLNVNTTIRTGDASSIRTGDASSIRTGDASSIRTGDASSFRSLAIIVQVGALAAAEDASPGLLKRAPDDNVISLPAQEQIINQ